MTSQLTANCCTTKLLRTQFPFSTPDQYKLEVPRVTGIVLEIRLTLRFNSLLNITVISDCKHLHWQTKKVCKTWGNPLPFKILHFSTVFV